MLNCAGRNITLAPRTAIARNSSGNRMSKHTATPILPYSVSNTVTSSPRSKVADSLNLMPGKFTSKRCALRCFAICFPLRSKTKQVLYIFPPSVSGTDPPTRIMPLSRAHADISFTASSWPSAANFLKYSFEYGQLNISGSTTISAPLCAASRTMRAAFSIVTACSVSVRS